MNRFILRITAYLTILCLLCVGLCGCGSDATVTPTTTTTDTAQESGTSEQQTTTQSTVTVTEEQRDENVTQDDDTTTAIVTATSSEAVTTTVPDRTTTVTEKVTTTTVRAVTTTTAVQLTATTTVTTTTDAPPVITALTPITAEEYYGYTLLKKSNNAALIETYNRIVVAVEAMQTPIDFTTQPHPPTPEELDTAWEYYRLDYPQHFWLARGEAGGYRCTIGYDTGKVKSMTVTYAMTAQERATRQAAMDKAVNAILSTVSGSDTPYERERRIHDALCERVVYDLKAARGHDMDGALVDGKAVCEGYSQAFQYLMYRAGILCGVTVGQKKGGENHKWNFVKIGDKTYYVDVTWDDVKKPSNATLSDLSTVHSYFNISESLLLRDHTIFKEENYPLPNCDSLNENYYKKNGTYITTRSLDDLIALLKKGNGKAEIYIADGDTDGYYEWFKSNCVQVAEAFGYTSYSYGHYRLGAGMVIYMKGE